MLFRSAPLLLLVLALPPCALTAPADVSNSDPAQWSGHEVYALLNNSPWSRPVKVKFTNSGPDTLGSQTSSVPVNNNPPSNPAMGGGMGRRGGMGGGRSAGTYNSGSGNSTPSAPKAGGNDVVVQWQSALIVRMATTRNADQPVDTASFKPQDEYVIAVIGLPITALGGPAASADSGSTLSQEEEERIQQHVKTSASLLRSGHDPLTPSKVELDQGKDGRMLLHFPKSDPITLGEKSVEFRLATGRAEIRKKFPLKEMEYKGNLDL